MKTHDETEAALEFLMGKLVKHHYTEGRMNQSQFTLLTGMQVALMWVLNTKTQTPCALQMMLDGKQMVFDDELPSKS